jgi:hypothetical protein
MHLDNWLFFAFIGVAMLLRLIAGAASKAKKDSTETERRSTTTPAPPLRPTRGDSQEDQIRKFLEALGRPTSFSPPPVVRPRTDVPPRPIAPVKPPDEMVASAPLKRRPPPAPKIRLPQEAAAPRQEKLVVYPQPPPAIPVEIPRAAATPLGPGAYDIVPQTEIVRREAKIDIVSLLRSRTGLRDAIVLREIFGPPRSMQDVDLIGIA